MHLPGRSLETHWRENDRVIASGLRLTFCAVLCAVPLIWSYCVSSKSFPDMLTAKQRYAGPANWNSVFVDRGFPRGDFLRGGFLRGGFCG